jgi:chromosome partitioning protein
MQTIVVNSQKGGSGKTTLCAHLAVQATRQGAGEVFLLDTDPQGTLTTWHEKREAEVPRRVELPFHDIDRGLGVLRDRGVAYCFIDTAPSRTGETAVLFKLADLVLVPIRPSPSDLWAAAATVDLVKRHGIPFLFILNQIKASANITAQAAAALSHHGAVAETFIADRVPYAQAMTDGRTAIELHPKGKAALETSALWHNILTHLQSLRRKETAHAESNPAHAGRAGAAQSHAVSGDEAAWRRTQRSHMAAPDTHTSQRSQGDQTGGRGQ